MRAFARDVPLSWQRIAAPELSSRLCLVTPSSQPQTQLPVDAARLAHAMLLRELGLDRPQRSKSARLAQAHRP
jgi:hypothetical protein